MSKIKQYIEDTVEDLMEYIVEKVQPLRKEIEELTETVNFVLDNGKDTVKVETKINCISAQYALSYLYKNKVKTCVTDLSPGMYCGTFGTLEVVKNGNNDIVFKHDGTYYLLDKEKNTYVKIPEPAFVKIEEEE